MASLVKSVPSSKKRNRKLALPSWLLPLVKQASLLAFWSVIKAISLRLIAPVAPASASIRLRLPPPPQPQHGVAAPALQPIQILYGSIYDDAKPRPR
ncbi:hypothetical protein Bca52824_081179 [Brassica carinata]|uniref:Uncharacterized protein n=1 Tax=Brassica carinata TaxID=52824 RepID=A0A8X7PI51_BRACI|nr:hypothetical protein Bca52824_081179 [Brassica carinata]